jgi:hypothetical protein
MSFENQHTINNEIAPHIHWGHFGTIMTAIVLLAGMTWVSKPELFQFNKEVAASDASVPHYYAYEASPDDIKPLVAGATTNPGPQVINDDGSVSPIDVGQVLGASTKDVVLSLDDIKVNEVSNSQLAAQKYFSDSKIIETSPVDSADFESALSSGDQTLINKQADKLISVRDSLQKIPVSTDLAKLQKLKILQYNSAIAVLQNFTQADQNPQLVGGSLSQFIKSQQELDNEAALIAKKYNLDPLTIGGSTDSSIQVGTAQAVDVVSASLK